jgi:hypothetical protein
MTAPHDAKAWPDARRIFSNGVASASTDPTPSRAARIAVVLVGFLSAPTDARSIEEMCRLSPVGLAPVTFRRWCQAEGIKPGEALQFARLLRALLMAREHGMPLSEWIDVDPRTLRRLLKRAGIAAMLASGIPELPEFIERQRLVRNPHVLKLVQRVST